MSVFQSIQSSLFNKVKSLIIGTWLRTRINPRHFRWLVLILLGVLVIMSSTQVVRVLIYDATGLWRHE
ncbi:hypothetical protein L7750_02555 [Xenorhabdus bovienii]|uniref:hypothetical protein n=2 Tax=Xenorhabdus bovienii TaxID=40576 RepID=UPI001EE14738|nr:hypothetical protein [Xenorhabdus bovienii]MCG3469315.1 hypothetical protein [Xenorhabdus bovienii]